MNFRSNMSREPLEFARLLKASIGDIKGTHCKGAWWCWRCIAKIAIDWHTGCLVAKLIRPESETVYMNIVAQPVEEQQIYETHFGEICGRGNS